MRRGLALLVHVSALAVGCGRLGFDAVDGTPPGDAGAPDGRPDAAPGPSALRFAQAANATGSAGDTQLTAPLGQDVEAGDLIVIGTSYNFNATGAPSAAATDSEGNAYAIATGPGAEPAYGQELAYAVAQTGGPLAVTMTISVPVGTFFEIMVVTYHGAAPLPFVVGGTALGTVPDTGSDQEIAGPPLAVPAAGTVLMGFVIAHPGFAEVGSPAIARVAINQDLLEDLVAPSAGTYTLTASASANATWTISAAAFR